MNVRASASNSGDRLGTLTHGTSVTVVGTNGEWSSIFCYDPWNEKIYGMNTPAYIKSEFLSSSIPINCEWIQRYGTAAHQYTNTRKDGCAELQHDLNRFFNLNLTEDGICGTNTVAAIRQFQDWWDLSVDGIAGNMTKNIYINPCTKVMAGAVYLPPLFVIQY